MPPPWPTTNFLDHVQATRSSVAERDLHVHEHASNRLHGLRLINNNYTSDGSGRDWAMFGDPGYCGGRRTPEARGGPHFGDRPANAPSLYGPRMKGMVRTSNWLLRQHGGKHKSGTLDTRPAVVKRWQRSASQPCGLDNAARIKKPQEDMAVQSLAERAKATLEREAQDSVEERWKSPPSKLETFPVDKHHWYSETETKNRKMDSLLNHGDRILTPAGTKALLPRDDQIVHTHYWFSCPEMNKSPHHLYEHPADGISGPRRRLHRAPTISRSMEELPKFPLPGCDLFLQKVP